MCCVSLSSWCLGDTLLAWWVSWNFRSMMSCSLTSHWYSYLFILKYSAMFYFILFYIFMPWLNQNCRSKMNRNCRSKPKKWLWQSSEDPSDWKRATITPIFKKRKKGRPRELQASQSHLCAWQDHGADPPGNYAKAHGKGGGDWWQPVWLP